MVYLILGLKVNEDPVATENGTLTENGKEFDLSNISVLLFKMPFPAVYCISVLLVA